MALVQSPRPLPHQQPRQLRVPARLHVHRQERDVPQDVAVAQPVVEGQAVQRPRTVGEAVHVVAQQVAVPVADPAVRQALLQQRAAPRDVGGGQLARPLHVRRVDHPRGARRQALEPLLPQAQDRLGRAGRADAGGRGGGTVQLRHRARHLAHQVARVRRVQQRGQAPRGGHAPHLDQVVAGGPVGLEHVQHAEVHVGGEAAVDLGLAPAGGQAVLAAAVVQEAQVHRLEQLVGAVADHRDHRDVGLDDLGRGVVGRHGARLPRAAPGRRRVRRR